MGLARLLRIKPSDRTILNGRINLSSAPGGSSLKHARRIHTRFAASRKKIRLVYRSSSKVWQISRINFVPYVPAPVLVHFPSFALGLPRHSKSGGRSQVPEQPIGCFALLNLNPFALTLICCPNAPLIPNPSPPEYRGRREPDFRW